MRVHFKKANRTNHRAVRIDLKVAIIRSGKTQKAIGLETRIGEIRVSQIVNGRRTPTIAEQRALAKAVRRPKADLFPAAM